MASYHVGAGIFGIYAGTLRPKRKDGCVVWREKSDVTNEAIDAVLTYIKSQMCINKETKFHNQYDFFDGTRVDVSISIVNEAEENKK